MSITAKRSAIITKNIVKIPIGANAKDGYAIVDINNQWLDGYNWCLKMSKNKKYAMSQINGRLTKMHRLILGSTADEEVDHINGDGLDNRLANLRLCTKRQNNYNRSKASNNTSGYKGVSISGNKFRAYYSIDGIHKHIGLFETAERAALAYDMKVKIAYGEFAKFNFPEKMKDIEF